MKPALSIRTVSFPSPDVAFASVVARCLADDRVESPEGLEQALRALYPAARVVARVLSGEPITTWYVYRDGRFRPEAADDWWREAANGLTVMDPDTTQVLDANEAVAGFIGQTVESMRGRPFAEFLAPDAKDAAAILFETILQTGVVHTIGAVVHRDGSPVMLEAYAAFDHGVVQSFTRRVRLAEQPGTGRLGITD